MRMLFIVLLAGLALISGCIEQGTGRAEVPKAEGGRLRVVATIFPLYEMAKAVGGERAEVTLLISPGNEVHSFEPTADKAKILANSDLLIVNGLGLEPWAQGLVDASGNGRLSVVVASEGISPLDLGGSPDPHVFEDPKQAQAELDNILKGMNDADPAGGAYYEENAQAYSRRLAQVDHSYQASLQRCRTRTVIVSHAFLGYVADDYRFKQVSLTGLSPEAETRAADLADAVSVAREDRVKFILYEQGTLPKAAQTAAEEAGIEAVPIAPAHEITVEDYDSGMTYEGLLMETQATLKKVMECD
jgi:zinc transport system substrate-binding protein